MTNESYDPIVIDTFYIHILTFQVKDNEPDSRVKRDESTRESEIGRKELYDKITE